MCEWFLGRSASYDTLYQPWWTHGPSSVEGLPKWCADARDLMKTRTEDEASQLIVAWTPLLCRLYLGRFLIAQNQRLHLWVGGLGSDVRAERLGFRVWV